MLSLFSSFDYQWGIFPTFLDLSILSLLFISSYFFNSSLYFVSSVSRAMTSFLESLSAKGYSKSSSSLFLLLMLFLFLLNFYSVFPFSFPHTSQVSVVLLMGLSFWVSFFLFFSYSSPKGFVSHCVPEGSPSVLVPLLFLIELISNLIRPVTLTVRLVANILAGHLLLILLSKVVYSVFWSILAYFFLNLVEFFVAAVQSYIFLTMVTLYYCDVA